ncbi:MAG: hypothetical protein ACR2NA_03685 [Solirubrobacterales bacterium]
MTKLTRGRRVITVIAAVGALGLAGCEGGDDPPRFAGGDLLPEGTVVAQDDSDQPASGRFSGNDAAAKVGITFDRGTVAVKRQAGAGRDIKELEGEDVRVTCGESLDRGAAGVARWPRGKDTVIVGVEGKSPGDAGAGVDTNVERCWLQGVPAIDVLAIAQMTQGAG